MLLKGFGFLLVFFITSISPVRNTRASVGPGYTGLVHVATTVITHQQRPPQAPTTVATAKTTTTATSTTTRTTALRAAAANKPAPALLPISIKIIPRKPSSLAKSNISQGGLEDLEGSRYFSSSTQNQEEATKTALWTQTPTSTKDTSNSSNPINSSTTSSDMKNQTSAGEEGSVPAMGKLRISLKLVTKTSQAAPRKTTTLDTFTVAPTASTEPALPVSQTPTTMLSTTATNTTTPRPAPTQIGAECFFSHQCEQLDPLSTCNKTHGNISTCVCPEGTFRGRLRSSCVPLPTKVKDECTYNLQCLQSVAHSYCDGQCACLSGYFSHLNGTQCQPEPRELGEVCGSSRQCERAVDAATCDSLTNTCVCQFGYEREEPTYCRKRQLLPTYEPLVAPPPASCHKACETWTNSMCVYTGDGSASKCQCLPRHAHRTNRTECVPVQTYNLTVHLTHEADLYDYVPLVYWPDYQNVTSPLYQELVDRVTLNGMARLFERTRLNRRYVSSEVTRLDHPAHTEVTRSSDDPKIIGVRAKVLLHLSATYLDALSLQDISSVLWKDLNRFYGELGQSRLKVKMPASEGVSVHDEDECAVSESNDCSPKATCLNTLGSYMCVCRPRYQDVSATTGKERGRECQEPVKVSLHSELCTSLNCDTNWEIVGLAVACFLFVMLAFIVYEIIQRKQTFNARKLYERFGTTKIRKLRRASIRRIQDAKRLKRESRKRKKEKKARKEEEKRLSMCIETGPEVKETKEKKTGLLSRFRRKKKEKVPSETAVEITEAEDVTPSPVNIVHPPSMPTAADTDTDTDTVIVEVCDVPAEPEDSVV